MLISHKTSVRSRANKKESITDKAATEATIYLYGDIGGWFGIDHQEWIKELNSLTADTIHIRIDSSGGDIFAARAMKTAVMQHKAKTIGHVDGLAASAASFFLMGCDEAEIVDGGFIMVHKAMSMIDILGYYNEDDLAELCEEMQKEMQLHGKINESIANDYAKKTKKKKEECLGWMEEETWFTAQDSLDNGLVDRIYEGEAVEGNHDLSIYAKVPDSLKCRDKSASKLKRAAEKALRDAGFSDKQAKTIIAKGYQEDSRDGDQTVTNPPETPAVPPIVDQLPVEPKRDVEAPVVVTAKKDRIADLLCRAEIVSPST
jgi:ATP-dependent Clp protease protease subunit